MKSRGRKNISKIMRNDHTTLDKLIILDSQRFDDDYVNLNDLLYSSGIKKRIKYFTVNSKYSYEVRGFQIHTIKDLIDLEKDVCSFILLKIHDIYLDVSNNKIFEGRKHHLGLITHYKIDQLASLELSDNRPLKVKKTIKLRDLIKWCV